MMQPPAGLEESVDADGAVLVWTLCNHARRNAVSPDMLRYIARRCDTLRGEVVVLTGAGSSTFCSGFDLTALRESIGTRARPADFPLPDVPLIHAAAAMEMADATFVASINGTTIGAGVELAAACDLRIASTAASFRVPAAELGVVYHARGVQRIRAAFGPGITARMLLLGQKVTASEAQARGAAIEVAPATELAAATAAATVALGHGHPRSIAGNRALLRALDAGALRDDFLRAHEGRRAAAYADLTAATAGAAPDRPRSEEVAPE